MNRTKRIFFLLAVSMPILLLSSCIGTQKMTVHGKPGTVIYATDLTEMATIDQSGTAELTLSRAKACSPLMLAKGPGDITYTPFALDFDGYSTTSTYLKAWLGFSLGLASTTAAIPLLIVSSETVPLGIALSAISVGSWIMAFPAMNKTATMNPYCDNYSYLTEQNANTDMGMASRDAYNRKMEEMKNAPKPAIKPKAQTKTQRPTPSTTPVTKNSQSHFYTDGNNILIVSDNGENMLVCFSSASDVLSALEVDANFFDAMFNSYRAGTATDRQRKMVVELTRDSQNSNRYAFTIENAFISRTTTCTFNRDRSSVEYQEVSDGAVTTKAHLSQTTQSALH